MNKVFLFYLLVISIFFIPSCNNDSQKSKSYLYQKKMVWKVPTVKEVLILPEYIIHDIVNMIDGNKYADILIPSFNPDMKKDSISKIAFAILKKEGLDEASFYVNVNAVKANFSSSFNNKHPDASKKGYLGAIIGNKFLSN